MEDSQGEIDPVAIIEKVIIKAREHLDRRKYVRLDSFIQQDPGLMGRRRGGSLWDKYRTIKVKIDAVTVRLRRDVSLPSLGFNGEDFGAVLLWSSAALATLRNGILRLKRSEELLLKVVRPALSTRLRERTAVKAHDN
jgi:hypothetical protein